MSLVTSESAKLVGEKLLLKTSVLESGAGEGRGAVLDDIDYLNGTDYRKAAGLRKEK